MRGILIAAVAGLAGVLSQGQANASEAPWCAVISRGDDVHWECQYRSLEECRPNVLAGNRGWCNPNPYFTAPAGRIQSRLRR
jgi:Protein of unknown function (DUF3551)